MKINITGNNTITKLCILEKKPSAFLASFITQSSSILRILTHIAKQGVVCSDKKVS